GNIAGEPVTADTIRDLLADADPSSTLRKLVTDAAGCIVDAGRARYAISDLQRRLISLRDGTCRFPGCTRPAENCEIDHATAYDSGGRTDLDNLGPLCKHHHQLKTHGGWHITASHRTGHCTWRSPLGRIYHHEPPGVPGET
ncbi:MAG: HNH endonuclease, partial [Actinomycetales bacterium]|nr:HNH endonuclease [Actinomycetales bacterium]